MQYFESDGIIINVEIVRQFITERAKFTVNSFNLCHIWHISSLKHLVLPVYHGGIPVTKLPLDELSFSWYQPVLRTHPFASSHWLFDTGRLRAGLHGDCLDIHKVTRWQHVMGARIAGFDMLSEGI